MNGNLGLVTFLSFDDIIEKHVREKMHLSFRMVNERDIPLLVEGLREWLIKAAGCFITVGHCRVPDLGYWYEYDALIEEFDELLLEFKEYIGTTYGLDLRSEYTLVRYKDNLSFVLLEGQNGLKEPSLGAGMYDGYESVWDNLKECFSKFEQKLTDQFGEDIDMESFFKDLAPEPFLRSLFEKHLEMRVTDEKGDSISFKRLPVNSGI